MTQVTLYHNPRCSKSRQALALLQERGVEPEVVLYLKAPPSAAELARIVDLLGGDPQALIRKKEAIFRERYADRSLSRDEWIQALIADPILIERPIAVTRDAARIGRPPETVLELC